MSNLERSVHAQEAADTSDPADFAGDGYSFIDQIQVTP